MTTVTCKLVEDDNALSGHLDIKQWNHAVPSIFGQLKQFTLDVSGSATGDTFNVSGGMVGQPDMRISITGRRLGEAA